MQPLGVLFFLQIGGLLYDKVGYWSPWALKGVADVLCGLWIISIYKRIKVSKDDLVFTMEWDEDAKKRLQNVPGAFREAAVAGTEEYARNNSHDRITVEVMDAYRKELGM